MAPVCSSRGLVMVYEGEDVHLKRCLCAYEGGDDHLDVFSP